MSSKVIEQLAVISQKLDVIIVLLGVFAVLSGARLIYIVWNRRKWYGNDASQQEYFSSLIARGQYDQVLDEIDAEIEDRPADTQLLWSKATALQRMGKIEEAERIYEVLLGNFCISHGSDRRLG